METNLIQAPSVPRTRLKISRAELGPLVGWCAVSLLVGLSIVAGLAVRRAVWSITAPIRFGDIQNGFYWAMQSSGPQGYLNQYEKMANEEANWGPWLDYAPLRLLVMNRWGTWVRRNFHQPADYGQREQWSPEYAFNRPVLDFNTAMDALGAVCAFFLTRLWVIRTRQRKKPDDKPTQFTGVIPALVAALTLWFNPAMLLSAYGWPTWDAWIIPMYLLAALLASLDWWFCAGLAIALGAMFKGQQLTVAPVFILWALMLGQLGSAGRWCAGIIVGMGVIASPWLFTYLPPDIISLVRWTFPNSSDFGGIPRIIDYPAIAWVIGVIAATALAPLLAERFTRKTALAPWPAAIERILLILALVPGISFVLLIFLPEYGPPDRGRRVALEMALLGIAIALTIIAARLYWKRREHPEKPVTWSIGDALCSEMFGNILVGIIIFAAAIWPWFLERNRSDLWLGMLLSAVVAFAMVGLRRAARPFIAAAAGGVACLLCIVVFHGSHGWWDCGFHYGTIHWQWMVMGKTDNLPGLLEFRYKWPMMATEHLTTFAPLPGYWPIFSKLHVWPAAPLDLTIKQLFDSVYTVLLLISGIGLGLHARRRDPRFLPALITPWVLFFTIPVQIHERYLLFAAGAAVICIGQSVGTYLLGLFLSFLTLVMTLHVMLLNGVDVGEFGTRLSVMLPWLFDPDCGHTIFKYVDGSFPDAGWATVLACGVFLYLSLAPTPSRIPKA
jgi:hypothetical protein